MAETDLGQAGEEELEDAEEELPSTDGQAKGAGPDGTVQPALHLEEQLGGEADDSGVQEAMRAWMEGGHGSVEEDDAEEIKPVHLAQLEPGLPQVKSRARLLDNVHVTVTVELGRREMTVRRISELKTQDVIELDKLAGESFEVRVNGRLFAQGEVVVVTDLMAVRITNLVSTQVARETEEE